MNSFDLGKFEKSQLLLDPNQLTKHALCLGSTGSGKTGLGIRLLEQASRQNLPLIIIDPKGDLTNLALTSQKPLPGFASQLKLEAAWGAWVDSYLNEFDNKARLSEGISEPNVDVTIYTPGSHHGVPVSIYPSLEMPSDVITSNEEAWADYVADTVSAILSLVPHGSQSSTFVAQILKHYWQKHQPLTLASLIPAIVTPPFETIGVFKIEEFWPVKQRTKLAMALNSHLLAPNFKLWSSGSELNIDSLFAGNKTKVSVFTITHLDPEMRMLFVTALLTKLTAWCATQPGSNDLRALFYMDEVHGFIPPAPKDPASKTPLMKLLKQARSAGLGVYLATQNPIDIDYKALSNVGTWFLGKLQTEQDQKRVLNSLPNDLNVADLKSQLRGLERREFILCDATGNKRFVVGRPLAYLKGPMTLAEIALLPKPNYKLKERALTPIYYNSNLELRSMPGESRDAFKQRLAVKVTEGREDALKELKRVSDLKLSRLLEQKKNLQRKKSQQEKNASNKFAVEVANLAESAFKWWMGKKPSVTSAITKRNNVGKAKHEIELLETQIDNVDSQVVELLDILDIKNAQLTQTWNDELSKIEEIKS